MHCEQQCISCALDCLDSLYSASSLSGVQCKRLLVRKAIALGAKGFRCNKII